MGVDFFRKAEERFKRKLREDSAAGLKPSPLFLPEEEETITYPCHWLHEDKTLPVGTALTIYNRGKRARIVVLHDVDAVGEVRGEAGRSLRLLFENQPKLLNMLQVRIVQVGLPSEPFFVQPARARKRKAKAV
jgi:hypothetical protein